MSIAWFTRLSFCRRRSHSASNLALFLKMLAWVSFRDLISPTADSAKALKSSLCLMTFSCWRRSASCFWALLNCARWLSMKAAGVNASSIDSGSLPSSSSKIVRIGYAFLIRWPMSWFRNWRDSWSLALISSDNTTGSADVACSPSSWGVAPIWKENKLLSGDSCAWQGDVIRMADGGKGMMKSAKGKDAYLLQAYFLYVGASRDEGLR